MPCSSHERHRDENTERLDHVTQLLCGLCRFMEGQELFQHYLKTKSPALQKWWIEHKKLDEIKAAEELKKKKLREAKKKALAKLTSEERRLLGL